MSEIPIVSLPTGGSFDLEQTLNSGQVFHWEAHRHAGTDGFAACIGDAPVSWIGQTGAEEIVTFERDKEKVLRYLGLDHDYSEIRATFPEGDEFLEKSIAYCPGIRIIRQPTWECLATFITSSLKQVAHIRAISLTIRERYGNRYELDGKSYYSYPDPSAMSVAGEEALRKCALGYRAKSLDLAANSIASGETDIEAIEQLEDPDEARELLTKLHGVGDKIANCVLLFGCGHWGTFPIDVWIERVLRTQYRKRIKGAKLQAWAVKHFGPNAGCAQQYLFHFARKTL